MTDTAAFGRLGAESGETFRYVPASTKSTKDTFGTACRRKGGDDTAARLGQRSSSCIPGQASSAKHNGKLVHKANRHCTLFPTVFTTATSRHRAQGYHT